jgi:hypothetical protein
MTHAPPWQVVPSAHTTPQRPQLVGSVKGSTHNGGSEPQLTVPLGQASQQLAPHRICPAGQVSPGLKTQLPSWHDATLKSHALPQAPQLLGSVGR